jgi:hypothetical protein
VAPPDWEIVPPALSARAEPALLPVIVLLITILPAAVSVSVVAADQLTAELTVMSPFWAPAAPVVTTTELELSEVPSAVAFRVALFPLASAVV